MSSRLAKTVLPTTVYPWLRGSSQRREAEQLTRYGLPSWAGQYISAFDEEELVTDSGVVVEELGVGGNRRVLVGRVRQFEQRHARDGGHFWRDGNRAKGCGWILTMSEMAKWLVQVAESDTITSRGRHRL
jgi:hypothetical protein